MLATQKGRSNPVRISCKRSEKLKSGSLIAARALPASLANAFLLRLLRHDRDFFAESPDTRITFVRLVWPEAMVTEDRGTFKSFAKNSMQASLARPSIGGAVRRELQRVAEFAGDGVLLGAGMDLDRKKSLPSLS